jgi:hypothetical protein
MIVKRHLTLILAFLLLSYPVQIYDTNPIDKTRDLKSISSNISLPSHDIDYLIITTSGFENTLEPLAIWKTQKGIVSHIEVISDIIQVYSGVSTTEKIKNCIIDYHTNYNTQWVLLAGDHNHVPTKYALCDDGFPYDGNVVCCDSYYSELDDNNWNDQVYDYEPEVYVGRLAANNINEMENLVQQLLNYEKNPPIGSWMSHSIFAASILQFDQDWDGDNSSDYGECDGNRVVNFINNTLIPDNWTNIFLAQTQGVKGTDYYADLQLNYNNLRSTINKGCSIGTIFAHGSPQSMGIDEWIIDYDGDMLFDYTADPYFEGGVAIDVSQRSSLIDTSYASLDPDDKLGLYYLGSCSTGTFDDVNDCLSEYFLKNAAIGCIAASYVAWSEDQWYERDHGGWFVDGLGFRFWEQLFKYNQPGKAFALAKEDYVSDRNSSPEPNDYPEWEDKTLKQYNLLGDPEVPIWLSIPKQINVSEIIAQNSDTLTLNVTAENEPIQNATVTYSINNILIWKGKTNENGTIVVPLDQINIDGKVFTVSKIGYLPYQKSILDNENPSSISGFNIVLVSIITICIMCISSIYYRHSKSKKLIN